MASPQGQPGRGREARGPTEIPFAGLRDVIARVVVQLNRDDVGLIAAGVAFYALLSIFPAIAGSLSLYGLFSDPANVTEQIKTFDQVLPPQAREIVIEQMTSVSASEDQALTFAAVFSLLVALWSANRGVRALLRGLSIAYNETESRGFIKLNAVSLAITAATGVGFLVAVALLSILPAIFDLLPFETIWDPLVRYGRWPVLAVTAAAWLSIIYRVGPHRTPAQWRWVAPGAVVATTLWLAVSFGFSIYVDHFASYQETYGAVGGVVVLMMWCFLTAFVVIVGAELNSELEHQTEMDSTVPPERPRGERGAFVADSLGKLRGADEQPAS